MKEGLAIIGSFVVLLMLGTMCSQVTPSRTRGAASGTKAAAIQTETSEAQPCKQVSPTPAKNDPGDRALAVGAGEMADGANNVVNQIGKILQVGDETRRKLLEADLESMNKKDSGGTNNDNE